ncbi:MAG: phosphate ABC transporter permease PstA [Tuberibacillus sp.]
MLKAKQVDRLMTLLIICSAFIMAGILIFLLGFILFRGVSHISLSFITSNSSSFQAGGGIKNQLWNSFYMLVLTMIMTVPIGLVGGIYFAEYAKDNKLTSLLRSCVEMLASLPSIIVGMFGMLLFVNVFGWGFSILSGALALTIFNLPVMIQVSEDALRSIPDHQRQGSAALGATPWQTVKKVLLPSAFPALLTGMILSAGRVFGESAALLFTAGLTSPNLDFSNWNPLAMNSPLNPMRTAETLSVHIWAVNSVGIIPDSAQVAAGASAVLVIVILIFNISARVIGRFIERAIKGK